MSRRSVGNIDYAATQPSSFFPCMASLTFFRCHQEWAFSPPLLCLPSQLASTVGHAIRSGLFSSSALPAFTACFNSGSGGSTFHAIVSELSNLCSWLLCSPDLSSRTWRHCSSLACRQKLGPTWQRRQLALLPRSSCQVCNFLLACACVYACVPACKKVLFFHMPSEVRA